MDITLHLPVRSYVYKYCRTVFGDAGKPFDYFKLNMNLKECKMLHALLERTPNRYEKYRQNEAVLNILIPTRIAIGKGCYLSQESIDIFNDYIKDVIMDQIVFFQTGIATKVGLKAIDKITIHQYQADKKIRVLRIKPEAAEKFYWQKSIIYDILAKYDITEDELSFDSIVKHLQRRCNFQLSA